MKKIFLPAILLIFATSSFAQVLLNGDFENNTAFPDLINLDNASFNSYMSDAYAFGSYGNLDIISTSTYCSIGAESGDWYIAFTGGGTDQLSLKINQPLTEGNSYTISFNDRWCDYGGYINHAFVFGLSEAQDSFGTTIYTASKPIQDVWTEKEFTFSAPGSGQYLTIMVDSGDAFTTWELLDNIKFAGKASEVPLVNNSAFDIYPNPSDGIVAIVSGTPFREIKIYDAIGQLMVNDIAPNENKHTSLDLSSLPDGIYSIVLFDAAYQPIARKQLIKGK